MRGLWRAGESGVMRRAVLQRLPLFGARPRLLVALLIVAALWAGFFWATATPVVQ